MLPEEGALPDTGVTRSNTPPPSPTPHGCLFFKVQLNSSWVQHLKEQKEKKKVNRSILQTILLYFWDVNSHVFMLRYIISYFMILMTKLFILGGLRTRRPWSRGHSPASVTAGCSQLPHS